MATSHEMRDGGQTLYCKLCRKTSNNRIAVQELFCPHCSTAHTHLADYIWLAKSGRKACLANTCAALLNWAVALWTASSESSLMPWLAWVNAGFAVFSAWLALGGAGDWWKYRKFLSL